MRSLSQLLRSAADDDFISPSGFALQCILLLLAGFAGNYCLFEFSPLQETIKLAQGFSDDQIAVLQGPAFYGPMIFASVPMGVLMARFPLSRLITILLALSAFGGAGTAMAPTFAFLASSRLVMGVAGGGVIIATASLIARLIKPEFRGRAYLLFGVAQLAGASVVFAVGGKLAAIFGSSGEGWRYAALWLALPLAIIALLSVLLREPVHQEARAGRARHALSELRALWAYRGVMLPLVVAPIIVNFGLSAANTWAAPIFARTFRMPADQVGGIMGVVILLGGVVGSGFGGLMSDYCQRTGGPRRIISFMTVLALLNVVAGCFGVVPTVASATVLLFSLYFFATTKGVSIMVASAAVIPAPLLGVCLGTQMTGYAIVLTLAPVAVAAISSNIGGESKIGYALAVIGGVASLVAALAYIFSRRYFASSIDTAPSASPRSPPHIAAK